MTALTFGSLFAGIGGMDLGLERAGMECKWQVEIDPYATKVLEKHWPQVRRYSDVRTVGAADLDSVDLIAGGFPCQDVSQAGGRVGIAGRRSGLWSEFARIISDLRPNYVLVENVPGLLVRGIDVVLGDLATLGYDAEWEIVSACSKGAPHTRERVFIVAYPERSGHSGRDSVFHYAFPTRDAQWKTHEGKSKWNDMERWLVQTFQTGDRPGNSTGIVGAPDGVPARLDRLKCLGNAVVPQVAEYVGRSIVADAGISGLINDRREER